MSNFEIKIPGTTFVLKNSMYQILPKADASAPDGFKEHGTTKVISPDIGNTVHAPFDVNLNVWNTGFFKASPCLRGMSPEEKDKFLKDVHEYIVKPVEEIKGEGILDHSAKNNFFDDFPITLKAKRFINTEEPLERLALYLAVLGKDLAPKEHSSNPIYGKADYVIVNKEEAVNIRQERELENNRAIGLFYNLFETDKEKLYGILEYLNITNAKTTDAATLNSIFNRWLKDKQDGYQNTAIFLKTYEKFKTEDGEEELYVYKKLKELNKANLIQHKRGEYFMDGESIGASYRIAAHNIMEKKADKEKFAQLVEQLQ